MSGLVREVDIQLDKYKSLPMGALLTQREAKCVQLSSEMEFSQQT